MVGRSTLPVLEVCLPNATDAEVAGWQRHVFAISSCGICGKASIDRVRVNAAPLTGNWPVSLAMLQTLSEKLRARQKTFAATGGLHGAMLFDIGKIIFDNCKLI